MKLSYLQTRNLNVGYAQKSGSVILFKDLSLSLTPGEMVCFMGPNGAGKSSLLRTLAGLQQPLSGSVTVMAPRKSAQTQQQVAVVLTDKVQALNLSVREVVTFGRYPYLGWNIRLSADDIAMVDAAIAQVKLEGLLNKRLYELSDGQLQMVMIARALAQDTPVILLDEPTAHLDLNNRVEIMNLLRDLSRTTQKAILLATHELDLALQTADRIWLTGRDANILQGLPEDLVLEGAFDDIFQFKGFDLKTGKVQHRPHQNRRVALRGEGAASLWTRNALERNGFEVGSEEAECFISVEQDSETLKWIIKRSGSVLEVNSIENLIKSL